jgi:putative MATE family efflux protein
VGWYNQPTVEIDKSYFSSLSKIAIPIGIQSGFNALLSMLDVLMIGQLGETAVAAAALANQIGFLLTFFLYGITSGAAAFTAQYWGKEDVPSIRKVLGICLVLCVSVAIVFTLIAEFLPSIALSIYTQDPAVIQLGARYLQIAGLSYLFSCISLSYSAVLKGMGLVRLPMAVTIVALSLKAFLSYTLIFGLFGLPQLGVLGGAAGTLAARVVEFCLLLLAVYLRRTPAAAHIRELLGFGRSFAMQYLKVALPVVLNECLWSTGYSFYNVIYAHIGTSAIAAVNVATSIESLAFVLLIANSDACGVLTGNQIGSGDEKTAYRYARQSLIQATGLGVLIGLVIIAISEFYPGLYQVDPEVRSTAHNVMIIMGLLFWVRGSNLTLIVGIMRAGGDTRFSAIIDTGTVWAVGIPMALAGAYFFQLPIWAVYLLVSADEITKYILGIRRFFSRRWIHNLAAVPAPTSVL